jgi:hypothetical protein
VGERVLGLRAGTAELVEAARAVLGPSLVAGEAPPANVSLLTTSRPLGRGLQWCYRSTNLAVRFRTPRRAVAAAVGFLSSFDDAPRAGRVDIPAVTLVRDGAAVLLSPMGRLLADSLVPRLRRTGWVLADTVRASVDALTGELVIDPPRLEIDHAALARVAGDPAEPAAEPGRYHVAAWQSVAEDGRPEADLGGRVATVASLVAEDGVTGTAVAARGVAAMLAGAQWQSFPLDISASAAGFAALS